MKKRFIGASILSVSLLTGVSATTAKAPTEERVYPADTFKKVVITPKILIRDYPDDRVIPTAKPSIAAIDHEAKAEVKSKPVPKGPYATRAEAKAAALAYAASRLNSTQFTCIKKLWAKESGWHYWKENPYSGAYGIPQALPGSKMAKFGDDWRTNPITQVKWGLSYVKGRYGSACRAWEFWKSRGWY